jgi:hypothetical protein
VRVGAFIYLGGTLGTTLSIDHVISLAR